MWITDGYWERENCRLNEDVDNEDDEYEDEDILYGGGSWPVWTGSHDVQKLISFALLSFAHT